MKKSSKEALLRLRARQLAKAADELGTVRTVLREYNSREEVARDMIVDSGVSVVQGDHYTAVVSRYNQEIVDLDAVRAKLGARWVARHMRSVPCTRVDVTANVSTSRPKLKEVKP